MTFSPSYESVPAIVPMGFVCPRSTRENLFDPVVRVSGSVVCFASCCEDRNWIPEVVNDGSYSEYSAKMLRDGTSEFKNSVSGGRFTRR